MPERENPVDDFRRVTAAAMRAIARHEEISVTFSGESPGITGNDVRLTLPSRELPAVEVANVRGEADSIALRLRHHDPVVHARQLPAGVISRAVFEAVEQARVEAIGARRMYGVASNLGVALEERCRARGYARVKDREDAPIAEVVGLLAREAMTGMLPPATAREMVGLWRSVFEARAGKSLASLLKHIDDQEIYGTVARQLIRELDLGDEDAADDGFSDLDNFNEEDADGDAQTDSADADSSGATPTSSSDPDEAGMEEGEGEGVADEDIDAELMPGGGDDDPTQPGRPYRPQDRRNMAAEPLYRAFTPEFDEVLDADSLCDAQELARLRLHLDQQLGHLQSVIARLANRLQRKLLAKQSRSWEFDLEEGLLDRRALGPRDRQSGVPAFLQAREGYRVPRHDRLVAHRQFRVNARPADHGGGHERRHTRPHARTLRGQGRDTWLHHTGLERGPGAREVACRR